MVMEYCLLALVLGIQATPLISTPIKPESRGVLSAEESEVSLKSTGPSAGLKSHSRRNLAVLDLLTSLVDPSHGKPHTGKLNHSSELVSSTGKAARPNFTRRTNASRNRSDNEQIQATKHRVENLLNSQLDEKWVANCLNGDRCMENATGATAPQSTSKEYTPVTSSIPLAKGRTSTHQHDASTDTHPIANVGLSIKQYTSPYVVTDLNTDGSNSSSKRNHETQDNGASRSPPIYDIPTGTSHIDTFIKSSNNVTDHSVNDTVHVNKYSNLNHQLLRSTGNSSRTSTAELKAKNDSLHRATTTVENVKTNLERISLNEDFYRLDSEELPSIPIMIHLNHIVPNRQHYKRRQMGARDIQLLLDSPDENGLKNTKTEDQLQERKQQSIPCIDKSTNLTDCENRMSSFERMAYVEDKTKKGSLGKRDSPYINRVLPLPEDHEDDTPLSYDINSIEPSFKLPSDNANTFLIIGGKWVVHYHTDSTTTQKPSTVSRAKNPSLAEKYSSEASYPDPLIGEPSSMYPFNLQIPSQPTATYANTVHNSYSPYEQATNNYHYPQNHNNPCTSKKLFKRQATFSNTGMSFRDNNSPEYFMEGNLLNYEDALANFPSSEVRLPSLDEQPNHPTATKPELFKEYDVDSTDMLVIGAQLISPNPRPEPQPDEPSNTLAPLSENELTYRRLAAGRRYDRYVQRPYSPPWIPTRIGDQLYSSVPYSNARAYARASVPPRYTVPRRSPSFRATDIGSSSGFWPAFPMPQQQAHFVENYPLKIPSDHSSSFEFVGGQYIKYPPAYEQTAQWNYRNSAARNLPCT